MAQTAKRNVSRFGLALMTGCVSLLVAGCSSPAAIRPAATPCNGGVCQAKVTVSWCWAGWISVDPDPIPVPSPNNIEWTFDTDGFSFPQNGIVIDPPATGFSPNPGVSGNGKKFTVHDAHSTTGMVKYTVRVVRDSDGAECRAKDPLINNQ